MSILLKISLDSDNIMFPIIIYEHRYKWVSIEYLVSI